MLKFFIFSLFLWRAQSSQILGIFPTPDIDRYMFGNRLLEALSKRGHQITIVSPFTDVQYNENITRIRLSQEIDLYTATKSSFTNKINTNFIKSTTHIYGEAYETTRALLSDPSFQMVLNSSPKFDLIIMEYYMNEALLGISKYFDAPALLVSPLPASSLMNELFANPAPSAYVPNILTGFTGKMNFGERLVNYFCNIFNKHYKYYVALPAQERLLQKYVRNDYSIHDAVESTSLVLLNSHSSITEPVPHTPNMVEVGGLHITPPGVLPEVVQNFMGEASGVVYFALDSDLTGSDLGKEKISDILKGLERLTDLNVVWNLHVDEDIGRVPSNVMIIEDVPHQDVISNTTHIYGEAYETTRALLSDPSFQMVLNSSPKFDLIIMEYYMNEALLGISKYFDAPALLVSPLPASSLMNELFANPAPSAYVPNILTGFTGKMNFGERLVNYFCNIFNKHYKYYVALPAQERLLQKYIRNDYSIHDAVESASLVLLNSHSSITEPVPHTPNMVEVGGLHITPPGVLPEVVQNFMGEASGVVYFALDSDLTGSDLGKEKISDILKGLERLTDLNVVWNLHVDEDIGRVPSNVMIIEDVPHQDIIKAYTKTRALLSDPCFQMVLNSSPKFDLIIMEYYMNEALLGISKYFDAPALLVSPLPASPLMNELFANPAPSAYVPNILTGFTGKMNFGERLVNYFCNIFNKHYKYYVALPAQERLLQKYIRNDYSIHDAVESASLMLLNSHSSITEPVPHTPNMVEVGGLHITPPGVLPEVVQNFMGEASGVVYFALDSDLTGSDLGKEKISDILKGLERLTDLNVVWNLHVDEDIGRVPSNVMIIEDVPHQDIIKAYETTRALLSDPSFQMVLNSSPKFDLIIMEYYMNEALLGISKYFDAPALLVSPLPASSLMNELFANPDPSAYVPNILTGFTGKMNFGERLVNYFCNIFNKHYKYYVALPAQERLLQKYVRNDYSIHDAVESASLMLLNSHSSITEPVPHTPNMVEVGGLHITPPGVLPEVVQNFMGEASGVVYFALDSDLTASDLGKEKISDILKGLERLTDLNVVWNLNVDEDIGRVPSNVMIIEDVPHQDIISQKNVIAFITDGNLFRIFEAIHYKKPIIGIPLIDDQKSNIAKAVEELYGVQLTFSDLTGERIYEAVQEILKKGHYSYNIREKSKLFKDHLVSPLDTAVYWSEYLIRNKGAKQFQSPGVHLPLFKRNLLDIIIVLTIIDIILFLIFYYIFKHIIHLVKRKYKERKMRKYVQLENGGDKK